MRAAPEAAENRFRVCQEQKIETFPKWNVSCRCRMPGNSRTPVKVRRRAAARNLLRSPDATPKQKRHLVDGVWVDKLPFSARDAWLAEHAKCMDWEIYKGYDDQPKSCGIVTDNVIT
eukprot:COSAG05_NODE_318_length_11494_cov_485.893813_1_plen_117_part_00